MKGHLEKPIKNGVMKWVLYFATLMICLYGALAFSGHDETGICLSVSLSTIDQPGGYAFTIGVSPCPVQALGRSIE